jgi:predicted glycoside hydrolase/deacetylase ChbG (UPF0249 family)
MKTETTKKLLIVNADDFGITRGATDAIIACHRAGSVTSTTFMSTQPAAAYAAVLAQAHKGLGVGLHFNLTLGVAASTTGASSITAATGKFFDRRELVLRAVGGTVSSREVRAELQAQYEAMLDFGLSPTHVDSHQHVHAVLPIFRVVSTFAAEHNLPLRLPRRWRQIGFNSYRTLLAPYREGVLELMVHPAEVDAELTQKTAITSTSAVEYRLLMAPEFVDLVVEAGFEFASYVAFKGKATSCAG